jgi:hypothetical protein
MITILIIEIKSKEHIYKKNLVNQLIIIFQKHNIEKHDVNLIQHDSQNMLIGWNATF